MTTPALEVQQLCSWYGPLPVLWDVELHVEAGEGVGLVGRNGAGKSTLLRSIAGVHRKLSGRIQVQGRPVQSRSAYDIARAGVSLVRETAPVFTEMTVLENIQLGAALARRRSQLPLPLSEVLDIFPALRERLGTVSGQLSGGQRQMLTLATAIISRPTILLLDEPSAGLAPESAATTFAAIGRLRQSGASILIAEQNRDWLSGVASRTVELVGGRARASENQVSA